MKIVIAGGGRVGGALASQLVEERHSVTVIDRDREVCDRLFEEVGVVTVAGDASDARTLERAGIRSADIAAGLLARDADNLAFAMLARSLAAARVMVRMLDNRYRDAYRLAGVHDVIAEADVVVAKMTTAIEFPALGASMPLASGEVVLFELPITARARVAGRTVAQVRADPGFPADCVFIGFVDAEGRFDVPTGSSVLRAGQTAVVAARRAQLEGAVEFLGAEPSKDGESTSPMMEGLRKVDFLQPLREAELGELARTMSLVRKEAGEQLFREGDPGEEFYVVLSGEVLLVRGDGEPAQAVGPGGFFGEISLLTGEPRSSSARASRESELLCIGRDAFSRVMMANPAIALEMSRILGQRLARATQGDPGEGQRRLFRR